MKCIAKVSTSNIITVLKRKKINLCKNLMEMSVLHVLNKFQGPYRQLQRNLSTTQQEEIRFESYNCFIQNHLRSKLFNPISKTTMIGIILSPHVYISIRLCVNLSGSSPANLKYFWKTSSFPVTIYDVPYTNVCAKSQRQICISTAVCSKYSQLAQAYIYASNSTLSVIPKFILVSDWQKIIDLDHH